MSYPESSEVSAGQPTASAHYNNLRKDALYLGMAAVDAASLGALLARYEYGLRLELLDTDRIRVPATATEAVYLVVNGYMLTAAANVDLSAGSRPSGAAAQYYVFAVRNGSSTTFTLDINTTSTETTDQRRIGGFYWDGSQIDASSIYTERRDYLLDNLGMKSKQVFGGRLTLVSGDPAPAAAVTGAGTIYYTPHMSNRVSLYGQGMGWKEHIFTELSLSLAGASANTPVDIFLYDDAGTLTLEYVEWTNASTRATALTTQDGVYVKSGAVTHLYLGTVGITSMAGVSEDRQFSRLVWNMYNRVLRPLYVTLGTNSWSYTTGAWRAASGSAVTYLRVVAGRPEEGILIIGSLLMSSGSANNAGVGIGVDSVLVNSAAIRAGHIEAGIGPAIATYADIVAEGLVTHYLIEYGAAGVTFYGSNGGSDAVRAGMSANFMM